MQVYQSWRPTRLAPRGNDVGKRSPVSREAPKFYNNTKSEMNIIVFIKYFCKKKKKILINTCNSFHSYFFIILFIIFFSFFFSGGPLVAGGRGGGHSNHPNPFPQLRA